MLLCDGSNRWRDSGGARSARGPAGCPRHHRNCAADKFCMAAAEKRGLMHRDLKPANLMLVNANESEVVGRTRNSVVRRTRCRTGREGKAELSVPLVKIIDFGLAKALNAPVDAMPLLSDCFVGTPAFASPEQFENAALDIRSDIYSLGATLWFAVTGKMPFEGHSIEEIRRAQRLNALPTKQLKAAHVSPALRSLLKSMLVVEPAARPRPHELAARLQYCSAQPKGVHYGHLTIAAAAILVVSATAFLFFRRHGATQMSFVGTHLAETNARPPPRA